MSSQFHGSPHNDLTLSQALEVLAHVAFRPITQVPCNNCITGIYHNLNEIRRAADNLGITKNNITIFLGIISGFPAIS